jgi:penicillin-binding protein 2
VSDRSRLRLIVLRVLVISLLATLLGRLWYLQVLAGPQFAQAAADNQVRDIVTTAPRGEIVDDRGRAWARNKTAMVVSVDRIALSRESDSGAAVLRRLGRVLGIGYQTLHDRVQLCGTPGAVPATCWNGSPYEPIPVTQLDPTTKSTRLALQILERKEEFPGVTAELAAVRHYPTPDGAWASHVLGYLGPITVDELKALPKAEQAPRARDLVGKSGLEAEYDDYLRGRAGVTEVAVDHLGGVTGTLKETPPRPGDTLVTSLDAKVQSSLENALHGAIQHAHQLGPGYAGGGPADFAAGVVLNAQTGHVVAMASYPSYDPALWDGGRISTKNYNAVHNAPASPLFDKAYMAAYSPGSTFKLISTAGLLKDGMASTSGSYDCTGNFDLNGQIFNNFEGEALGYLSLHTTIVKSCDTVYYRLAYQDWIRDNNLVLAHKPPVEGVQHMARDFGIGEPPNVDLPDANEGHIADRRNTLLRWKELKHDACIGAKTRKPGDPIKAYDQEFCTDGWRFNPGDQLNEDIGQGTVLVSPLQLATAYSALANGGTVFDPRVGQAILRPNGSLLKTINAPVRDHLPLPKDQLDYIRNAMYDVPVDGTAAGAFIGFPRNKVLVGGKTGTAEVGTDAKYTSAWFASFAGLRGKPPQFVTVIMVDKGGVGGSVAAPAVRQVWDTVFGLEGHKAAFPTGRPPAALPQPPGADQGTAGGTTTKSGRQAVGLPWPTPTDLALPPALAVRFENRERRGSE